MDTTPKRTKPRKFNPTKVMTIFTQMSKDVKNNTFLFEKETEFDIYCAKFNENSSHFMARKSGEPHIEQTIQLSLNNHEKPKMLISSEVFYSTFDNIFQTKRFIHEKFKKIDPHGEVLDISIRIYPNKDFFRQDTLLPFIILIRGLPSALKPTPIKKRIQQLREQYTLKLTDVIKTSVITVENEESEDWFTTFITTLLEDVANDMTDISKSTYHYFKDKIMNVTKEGNRIFITYKRN